MSRRPSGTLLTCAVVAALAGGACGEDDLEVAYLYVDTPAIAPLGAPEAGDLVGVRVVVDAESLGFYPTPVTVPVLGLGRRTVRVEPAVRRSGLAGVIDVYPLFAPLVRELDLRAGRTDTLRPVASYVDGAEIAFAERFEGPRTQLVLDLAPGGSPGIEIVDEGAREGRGAGVIAVSAESPVFEVASAVIRPDGGGLLDLWVELDYRGEGVLQVALLPEDIGAADPTAPSLRYFQGALPREDWTRLYFDIVDASNDDYVAEAFRLSLLVVYDEALGPSQRVFLDNLRVVYR